MNNPYPEIKRLEPVVETIAQEAYRILHAKTESEFYIGKLISECGTKHCSEGHLRAYFGEKETYKVLRVTKNALSFGYYLWEVNDGKEPNYPQSTPKARVLALLEDMIKAGY